MGEISPREVSSSSPADRVGPVGATALAGARIAAILAALSSSSRRALAVTAWSSCSAFWRAIANSASICSADHCILGVELTPGATGFVSPGAGGLAGAEELARVVAGIVMTS